MKLPTRFPTFIRENNHILKAASIPKHFKDLGLPDCKGKISPNFKEEILLTLLYCANIYPYNSVILDYISQIRANFTDDLKICQDIASVPKKSSTSRTPFIRKGTKLITAIKKLRVLAKDIYCSGSGLDRVILDSFIQQLDYVEVLASKKKLRIVFSTDPWDIATMSMRGITSCMQWSSIHSPHLIGSILDPNAGVIYLTDDKATEHGPRMIFRAVVRIVIDEYLKPKNPRFLIDKTYSFNAQPNIKASHHMEAVHIFRDFLFKKISNSKLNDKLDYFPGNYSRYNRIPLDEKIAPLTTKERSCVDSGTLYASDISTLSQILD